MIVDLIAQADDSQLRRANQRLSSLRSDLAAQQCQAGESVASR
jgi:hypothetical protein